MLMKFSPSLVILKAMWTQKHHISAVTSHENWLNLEFLGFNEPTWSKDDIGVQNSLLLDMFCISKYW